MLDTLKLNARLLPNGIRLSIGYPYDGTEYYQIAKNLDLISDERSFHNYLDGSILKWSADELLWIDKIRSIYWWWINSYLDNDAAGIYKELVDYVIAIPAENWFKGNTKKEITAIDFSISKHLRAREISHYGVPFQERPDIAILFNEVNFEREYLDEHYKVNHEKPPLL